MKRILITFSLLCLSGLSLFAQNSQPTSNQPPTAAAQIPSSYEGQNVAAIEIAGRADATASQYASLFVQQVGQPFSTEKVDQTAAALKSVGKFEAVHVQVEPEATGVRVVFVLEPAIYFGIFEFPGAQRFPYSRLVQVANYPVQTPLNGAEVERDHRDLVKFYRQQGYFEATVSPEVSVSQEHGIANIAFHTTLGRKARFGEVDIAGAPTEDSSRLDHSLQTFAARVRGVAIRPGRAYNYSTITKASEYLQSQLQKQGRLGADVRLSGAEYQADSHRADIHFDVSPGPQTHVEVDGAHLWSWTRKALLPVYQGVGVDDESVEEGRRALESYFQAKGFFDVKVDAQLASGKSGNTIVYKVAKEKKHKVTEVKVSGNSVLPASDLTPHLAVERSHWFSSGRFSDQLVRTSVKNLRAVYQSEGFSSIQVVPQVVNHGGDIQISFRVTEGVRDVVNSLTIEGAYTYPQSQFAPRGLKLSVGQPYSQAHIEEDRANIVSHYLNAGYLASSFHETATEVSKSEPHRINVIYHINEGPKVDAGYVVTLGRAQTKQRLIDQDVSSINPGQPLTETQLLTAGSKLYDHTGVFDWAEVDPKREIAAQTNEDVLVKVHEAKRNEITYGFGFEVINRGGNIPSGTVTLPNLPPVGLPSGYTVSQETFYGPRGSFQYTRNNVGGKGDSISFTGFAGRLDQRGAAYYIVPDFLWSPWKATLSISGEHNEENPVFSAQEEVAGFQVQRPLDKARKDTLILRYAFTQTDLPRVEIPVLVPADDLHVRLSTLAANLTRDTRDNALDEHKGVLESIEGDFNSTKLGSSVDFAKLTGQFAYYEQALHKIVWANSIRIGLAQPYANSRVPLSEEFFTGGGNSLRGFPLDGAGPQRPVSISVGGCTSTCPTILVPSGGNELLLINSEARIPLPFKKGLGMVGFYDGGNVFPRVGFHDFGSLYSNNVGVGLRYATPVGPVRVDLGRNLNPIQGINATQYFISIGQAF